MQSILYGVRVPPAEILAELIMPVLKMSLKIDKTDEYCNFTVGHQMFFSTAVILCSWKSCFLSGHHNPVVPCVNPKKVINFSRQKRYEAWFLGTVVIAAG